MQKINIFFNSMKRRWKLGAGIIGALVVGGTTSLVVLAAIPGTGGVIHGCYRSSGLLANGAVRIIDNTTATCASNETAITWNQTGPQGPQGPQGPSGSEDVDGKFYTKMLTVPATETDDNLVTILDIPSVGKFEQARCFNNGPGLGQGRKVIYTNTTGHSVNLVDYAVVPAGQNYELNPSVGHGTEPYMNLSRQDQYMVNYDNGSGDFKVARILLGLQYLEVSGVAVSCNVVAQAIVSE